MYVTVSYPDLRGEPLLEAFQKELNSTQDWKLIVSLLAPFGLALFRAGHCTRKKLVPTLALVFLHLTIGTMLEFD